MKVDIGGKQFEVGQPNELSAKILKLIQDEAGTPLEAMAAIDGSGLIRISPRDITRRQRTVSSPVENNDRFQLHPTASACNR